MATRSHRRAPDRELLLSTHDFPGEYIIKAFGPGSEAFHAQVVACAHGVVGEGRTRQSRRATRSGHKMCVTLTLQVEEVDEVIAIYQRVHEVDGLMLIL